MKKTSFLILIGILAIIFTMESCKTVKRTFDSMSPYEEYKKSLTDSPIGDKPMVRDWKQAGDSALSQAVQTSIPHKITVSYFKDEPVAYSWQFDMNQGRILNARISSMDTTHQVFMDLFAIENSSGDPSRMLSAEDSLLHYESDQNQTVILRLQPELLVSGSITLSITDKPSMNFPVAEASPADIKSFWGAPRDGGARRHEGVDIFADRGTPAVAAAKGQISRTGTSNLGGNVVWLRADGRGLYYAHLDSITVQRRQQVEVGDTLGLVGNTGNARTTPPHLHFGIYDNGAVNPLPFIDNPSPIPADPNVDATLIGKWSRVQNPKANVRPLPSTERPPIASLNQNEAVRILGATDSWYQIKLPDNRKGFIYGPLLESTEEPLETISTATGDSLFEHFSAQNPLLVMSSDQDMPAFGHYGNKQLVGYENRLMWINSGR
jgi:murein DD-endopeptidase MepM/ murein hydrolase activator NlpD